ncbi:MAG: hypothetical protein H7Y88_09765 [Phycisphaerales bacterium]|nr:hypothetical protein [Phycisphaerales bacterium]
MGASLLWAPMALAQVGSQGGERASPDPTGLRRVEQGVEDVGPQSVIRREMSVDMRVPTGFGSVYRLPPGAFGLRRGGFARKSGGLTAVFDRSLYSTTRDGAQAQVPPGTIFYIGNGPVEDDAGSSLSGAPGHPASENLMDLSVSLRSGGDSMSAAVPEAMRAELQVSESDPNPTGAMSGARGGTEGAPPPHVMRDERYRAQRTSELLAAAARPATVRTLR